MIDDIIIQLIIDFLDDVQMKAAEDNDTAMLEFVQDIITELINADEVFDNENEAIDHIKNFRKNNKKEDIDLSYYHEYFSNLINFAKNNPMKHDNNKELSKEELKKLYNYFTQLHKETQSNLDKKRKRKNDKDSSEDASDTSELTKDEINKRKFDIYYQKRQQKKESKGSKSLDKMIKDLGLDLPKNK